LLKADGTVWAWGRNNYRQCGQKNILEDITKPVQINELNNIIQISCGIHHSVALDKNGNVWRWGTIHDTLESESWEGLPHDTPYMIEGLVDIVWIVCGQEYFYALDRHGRLWGYGSNYYGALGNGFAEFVDVPVLVTNDFQKVTSVYICCKEAYALTDEGKVLRWSFQRKLNANESAKTVMTAPETVDELENIIAISTTDSNAIAMATDGTLWSWGDNFDSALGYNIPYDITNTIFFEPKKIAAIPPAPTSAIITAGRAAAIYADEIVWAWGVNFSTSTPVRILPDMDISSRTTVTNPTSYNKYYIAFLDILGFKDLIKNKENAVSFMDQSLIAKSRLDLLAHFCERISALNLNGILMSDSVVITIRADIENALRKLLVTVAEINGMLNGAITRGAISYGDLYHQNNVIFGPSFITAYQLQEFRAVYPRIIVNSSDVKLISRLSSSNKKIMDKYFLLDDDNEIFFDYLSYLRDEPSYGYSLDNVMSGLTDAVMINYFGSQKIDERIADKYKWLLKYIFIWQIKNPFILAFMSFFKFSIKYYRNRDNVSDFQNCMPVFVDKAIIKYDDFVLLTEESKLPYRVQSEKSSADFINTIKSRFANNEVIFTTTQGIDFFNCFGIEIYNDPYVKRGIFEISKYSCFCVDSKDLTPASNYIWAEISTLPNDLMNVIMAFL